MINRFTLIILLLSIFIACNGKKYKRFSKQSYSMNTILEITFYSYNEKEALAILDKCFDLADDLEKRVSCTIKNSLVSNLNEKKELLIEDEFLLNLIKDSINLSNLTKGAFDPSLFNLIDLWGFDSDKYRVPDNYDIEKTLKTIGYKNIIIDGNLIKLKNGISLNFGAIAKGRIIGEISNYLKNNGIKDYLINGGGDLVVSGKFEGKRLWRIAISDPFEKNKLTGVIELTDCSIVTSGDYERNFIGDDGKLYHHILDPKTGYPANNGVHSVTVITDEPGKADALATALFVMGVKSGLDFVDEYPGIDSIFISGNKKNKEFYISKNITKSKQGDDFWKFIYKKN